ncbi:2-oxoacid:ferredoxin oxidoreductase subunit beta [Bacteroidetes/Chlorobi group bacterium Naka2016]|jgi:2-oxoglutarate ferredoxin oxidoreductase subunit beta|nr:MAG: 2-oxoacid:ferredoxin oxidoreductase subunit beta [Bacteroidetes/Chlorobi group bacterium Naka2016]
MTTLVDKIIQTKPISAIEYAPKDFKSPLEVRWCSGCGDYSILSQVQKVLAGLKIPREQFAFISGIGCSSRFPYYMQTYGIHGIHGRAVIIATGLKIARPDLSVWVVTGDGDCLSIGGNHFIHAARRNIGLKVLLFNNGIYSLTKGQVAPTTQFGSPTKSTPYGNIDYPFNPVALALGSGSSFVARTFDRDPKHMQYILERAGRHNGFAFVEIYSNCVIYNDGAYDLYTSAETRKEHSIMLEHGKPLIFGTNNDKGIRLDGFTPTVVSLADGKWSVNDLIVHNEQDSTLAFILANMTYNPELPRPFGIFQAIQKPTYEELVAKQIEEAKAKTPDTSIETLLKGDSYWEIK